MKSSFIKSAFTAASLVLLGAGMTAHAGPFDELSVVDESISFSAYESVYVAPVKMDLTFDRKFRVSGPTRQLPRGASRPMTDAEIDRNAQELHERLERRLSKNFAIADAPGDGVLTVEATVTRLISTRPTNKEIQLEVGLDLQNSVSAGGADIDVLLSENGEARAELSESFKGRFRDGLPRIHTWQDAEFAYNRLARKLTKYIAKN